MNTCSTHTHTQTHSHVFLITPPGYDDAYGNGVIARGLHLIDVCRKWWADVCIWFAH